jgi:hypothetical protein
MQWWEARRRQCFELHNIQSREFESIKWCLKRTCCLVYSCDGTHNSQVTFPSILPTFVLRWLPCQIQYTFNISTLNWLSGFRFQNCFLKVKHIILNNIKQLQYHLTLIVHKWFKFQYYWSAARLNSRFNSSAVC